MLEVTINEGLGENILEPIYQYDVGRTLKIRGMDFETPPPVHFANSADGKALIVESTLNADGILVKIPNTLLAEPLPIFAYIYSVNGETGQTVSVIRIPIIKRPKPEDWEPLSDEDLIRLEKMNERLSQTISEWAESIADTQEMIDTLIIKVNSVTSSTVSLALGMYNSNTQFNADGSITENGDGWTRYTTFNADGSITERFTTEDPDTGETKIVTKVTTFNADGSIVSTITE